MPLILVSPYLRKVISDLFPPIQQAFDPYLDYVTFLLRAESTTDESGVNPLFKDELGADLTISGAPIASPGKFGNAIRLGNTGYLRTTARQFARVGRSDFTFEFFVRINSLGAVGDHDYVAFDLYPLQGGMHTDRKFYFTNYGSWNTLVSNIEMKTNGDWMHVAIARNFGTTRMFFDGKVVATTTALNNVDLSQTADFGIGARALNHGLTRTTSGNYDIDELRLSAGVCRYSAEFTPPTAPSSSSFLDARWSQTTALLPLSSDLLDARKNAVSVFGNVQLDARKFKFGTQSAYFDGDADYLTLPASVGQFGTGDFTIECWVCPESYVNAQSSGASILVSQYAGGDTLRWNLSLESNGTSFTIQQPNGTHTSCTNSRAVPLNKWSHVAVVRNVGTVIVYVNGYPSGGFNLSGALNINAPVGVGRFINAVSPYLQQFKGFMQDLRITRYSRYMKAFAVPNQPHKVHTHKAAMVMLMQGNAAVAVGPTTFVEAYGRTVTYNEAQYEVALINDGLNGGSCASFNGLSALIITGGGLANDDFVIGLGDYNVTAYIYITSHNNAYRTIVSTAHDNDAHGFYLGIHMNGCLMGYEGAGSWVGPEKVAPNAVPLNQWVKVQLRRDAGVSKLLMNDVEQLNWASAVNMTNPTNKMAIGMRKIGSWSQGFTGRIDDVRFSRS